VLQHVDWFTVKSKIEQGMGPSEEPIHNSISDAEAEAKNAVSARTKLKVFIGGRSHRRVARLVCFYPFLCLKSTAHPAPIANNSNNRPGQFRGGHSVCNS
jgi:hypothetical protein